ncbi:MAG: amidohydrolase [Pseudomonadales bacterium]|nr:amidohydrolase [Pseudomonadales bacterium]
MFKERDNALTPEFHELATPTQALKHDDTAPCTCCSPVFSALVHEANWDDMTSPEAWREAGSRRDIYTPAAIAIFVNAKVITMDDDFSEASCVAIQGEKILAVGDREDMEKLEAPDAEIIDCEGKTLLPGFIEPHFHFLPCSTMEAFENVGPFRFETVHGALDRLQELAESAGPDEWIMGRQFDPSLQQGPDLLTRQLLDQVSTSNPVFVYNASMHFAYCNSKALEVAGITKDTPDNPNSPFYRDDNGEPNGVLAGGIAIGAVAKHNPAGKTLDLVANSLAVVKRANSLGITLFCDQATGMTRGVKEIDVYNTLAQSPDMTTRLRYSLSYGIQERWDNYDISCGDGNHVVRCTSWKIVSDGSNQGFSGLQREPYLYREDKGIPYVEADILKDMVVDRANRGWALAIHANGDQAIDNVLDAYENAFDQGLLTNTPCRIEHCSILHDEHIERIAKMGLSPSFLIGHVYYWGQAMRDKVFGHSKACLLDRTAACEEKGIRWTLHSDEPVTEMGPLRCVENAVTRKMWKEPETILAAEECISVEAALRSITRDAAWQCHSDHEVGTIEPGKFADFVVLEADPREVDPNDIGNIQVLETWMGGRRVYSSQSR